MNLEERVYSILIVSAVSNFNSALKTVLPDCKFSPIRVENSISAANRLLLERSFDFVIINSPLPDDTGLRFAIDVCSEKNGIALMFVKGELYETTYDRVAEYGVFVLSKPTSKQILLQAIDWMIASRLRLNRLQKKTVSIEDKMSEIRIVNRAKWLLIENMKITEEEAHRYIQKESMDHCVSRREIAEKIINTYS